MDGLSEKAFGVYGVQVVVVLCFSKRESRQFKNTKMEVSSLLEWIPELEKYRGVLQELIKKQRRKYNFKV